MTGVRTYRTRVTPAPGWARFDQVVKNHLPPSVRSIHIDYQLDILLLKQII